jgi:hypothetical protein
MVWRSTFALLQLLEHAPSRAGIKTTRWIVPMGWASVAPGVDPVLRRFDLGVHPGVLLQQVQEVASRQQLQWLVVGESNDA